MSDGALRAPASEERFTVRTLHHEEVDHWFRVYATTGPSNGSGPLSFNLGWGSSRFAPIEIDGHPAHTYYAASTLDCALLESVLHDVPLLPPPMYSLARLDGYRVARLRMHSAIRYLSFHSHDLAKLGLSRSQMIDQQAADHALTRAWSQAGLTQRPDAQAIGYTSRQNDAGRCLMLVRQRLPEPAFEVLDDTCLGTSPKLRRAFIDLAASLGIALL